MCGLCGVLGAEDHWTDASARPSTFAGRHDPPTRRRERLERAALVNRVLKPYGLKLADWQGASYVLSSATGRFEIVPHLAALWPAAERLLKRPPDPLDPGLLAALERG